ncbi:MAG: CHASE2 domain-containing serine/threonine-protein kinase [Miltoncostaeaceae bacterium]
MRLRIITALVLMLAPVTGLVLWATGTLQRVEIESEHWRFQVRGERADAVPDVVFAVFDEGTLEELGEQWPPPRAVHAEVIDALRARGASAIGYDIAFTEPSAFGAADDRALSDAARRAGNVVFAATKAAPDGGTETLAWLPGGRAHLDRIGARAGYTGFQVNRDWPVSSIPARWSGLDAFAVAVAAQAGMAVPDSVFADGDAKIDFAGPAGTVRTVPVGDLLAGRVPAVAIRGKAVVVGTDLTTPVDRLTTTAPGNDTLPGGEVHAQAVQNSLDGRFMSTSPWPVDVLLIIAMGMVIPVTGLALRRQLWAATGGVAALLAFLITAQSSFDAGVIIPVITPLIAFGVSIAAWLVLSYVRADAERRDLRRRFAAADEAAVDQVLHGTQVGGDDAADLIAPGYHLVDVLGRGAAGVVYRAEEIRTGRAVAVKVLAPDVAGDPGFRERFRREARVATQLEHPNVLPVFAAEDDDEVLFMAMRLVEGGDLAAAMRAGGPLGPAEALRIGDAVASALDAAHARGLVHRDVKPANVLVDRAAGGHVYLTDFGIARSTQEGTISSHGDVLGTAGYAAPEQIMGEDTGPPADVYGLGAVLFAMLTGAAPYARGTAGASLSAALTEPPPGVPGYPALDPVIARALARDPAGRFASAADLMAAAHRALGG